MRVQLDLSPMISDRLDQMVRTSGLATRAEVLRRAISVYAALLDEATAGNRIEVVTPKGERKQLLL